MRRTSLGFLAAIVIISGLVFVRPMPAAAAPSEQEQLAALVSQVETLTRLFEAFKRNFIKPAHAVAACADGIDNDHDGAIDYPTDTGCYGADDPDEAYYSTTGGTSSSSGSYSSCSASLISLLGDGCHYMYADSAGNSIYCDGPMTKSAKTGDTATAAGCSSSTSSSSTYSSSTSCSTGTQSSCTADASCAWVTAQNSVAYCDVKSSYTGDSSSCPGFASSQWDTTGKRYCKLNKATACQYAHPAYMDSNNYSVANCPSTGGTTSSTQTTTTSTGGTTTATPGSSANLTATAAGTDVTLTWTDFYTGEDIYRVDRRIGTGEWIQTGTIPYLAGGTGSYKDAGVGTGTYDYRVRPCMNTSGCYGESNAARVTVGGSSTSTTAPPTATPPPVIGNIVVSGITSSGATIGWTTDIPATSKIEYGVGSATQNISYQAFITNHSIYLSGLTASTTYVYNVISENTDYYRTTFSGKTFTTASVGGGTGTATGSCNSALTALLGTGCHQMYTDNSGNAIYCNGDMTQSAKQGDTVITSGCTSSGHGSTNSTWVSHTWRFKDGSAQYSQILSRTDAEYTTFIAGVDSSAAGGYFGGWKPGSGTDTNWQEFGIPVVSQTSTGTTGTWQCSDGRDNDGDGYIDYPADTSCYGRDDNDEWYPTSGGQTGTTTPSGIPAAPTGLTAVQSFADVLLSWQDNATNEDTHKVEWYNGTDWIVMAGSPGILYGGRGTYTDRSPSLRTHQYRVRACNSAGCSPESNIALILVSGSGTGTTTPATAPALSYLTPPSGPIGAKVTITGSGFTPTGNSVNFDTGVIMDLPSSDGKTITFVVPGDRVPLCAQTGQRCLLPAPYNPVKPGTYWVSVANSNGTSGGFSFSVIESVASVFMVDPTGTFPKPGATGVETGTRIRVRFTREMDSASTAREFFRITKTATSDVRVSGSFSVFSDGFEFIPSDTLDPKTSYTYAVLTSLRDRAGNPLSSAYTASFTTGGASANIGELSGKVTDADGAPLPDSYIHLYTPYAPIPYAAGVSSEYRNYFSRYMETDAQGAFRISIPPGTYVLEAYPPYGRTDLSRLAPRKVTIVAGETKTENIAFGSAAKVITGTVRFEGGGVVDDAEVAAYATETRQWKNVSTDAEGRYTLKVGIGSWMVGVYPRDEKTAQWSWYGKPQPARFGRTDAPETITRDFIVTARNIALTVAAVDETGIPIAGAGIIVDAHKGASLVASGSEAPTQFRITGSDGKATFSLGAGTYYLRGYVPHDRGYFHPDEQEVILTGATAKDARMVFKKKQSVKPLAVSGVAKTEEGVPVDAFIWAWSERGGSVTARADAGGAFSLAVTPDARWHIGAGKEYKGFPYKSPEIVVDVKTVAVVIELLLTKQTLAPLPPSISVSEPGSQQVVAQAADGAQLTLPPASAAASGDIKVEIKPTVEAPIQAGTDVVSTVYDVTVHDAAGKEVNTLAQEAEIVIPYDEAELKKQGVGEDALTPSYFDEGTGAWVRLDGCTIDKERNVAVCKIDHLTRFAITARADATPPAAPASVVAKQAGVGRISITWKNPAKDFDYAKVYRSAKMGELGAVRAAKLRASAFSDGEGLADGTTYYYTVRAVDAAGNESANTAQVSAVAKGSSGASSGTVSVPVSVGGGITRMLKRGMRGDDVKMLQQILADQGLLASDSATGFFGPATEAAVKKFQAAAGLEQVGFAGPATRKKINALAQ